MMPCVVLCCVVLCCTPTSWVAVVSQLVERLSRLQTAWVSWVQIPPRAALLLFFKRKSCPGCSWLVCCAFAFVPRYQVVETCLGSRYSFSNNFSSKSKKKVGVLYSIYFYRKTYILFSVSWRIQFMCSGQCIIIILLMVLFFVVEFFVLRVL